MTYSPFDPDKEAEAKRLAAKLTELMDRIRAESESDRELLRQARRHQGEARWISEELIQVRGNGFLFAEDTDAVCDMLLDALETVRTLVFESVYADDAVWPRLQATFEEIDYARADAAAYRREIEADLPVGCDGTG